MVAHITTMLAMQEKLRLLFWQIWNVLFSFLEFQFDWIRNSSRRVGRTSLADVGLALSELSPCPALILEIQTKKQ